MRKIRIDFKVIVIITFLLLSCSALTAIGQNRSTVSGFIFDNQGKPLYNVRVELLNEVNSVLKRIRTDASGRYFFSGLSSGQFVIRALPIGTNYEEQTQDVEIAGINNLGRPLSENLQKDFYLRIRQNQKKLNQIAGAIFVQEVPKEAEIQYKKGIADLEEKKIDLGVAGLENAIKLFPNYYMALEKLGILFISQQKYEKARNLFSQAVIINERGFNSWYGLGYANYSLKQTEKAIDAVQKAVSINPTSVEALLLLGITLRLDKQYQESEKALKSADKFSEGKSRDVHWYLALLYAQNLKRFKEAADELEVYLKIYPATPNSEAVKKLIKQFREAVPTTK
jgi:tetratricopeptide (TPR) repeat protein